MGRKRRLAPFECEIETLAPRGLGRGTAPDGNPVQVRSAPPGSRIAVVPMGRRKGVWSARRAAMIRPPVDHVTPECPQFGLCGGCVLQEISLEAQRAHKHALAVGLVAQAVPLDDVVVHPVRGAPHAYRYRNKVELSFGSRRWVSEADQLARVPLDGRFLGFHAPGRFDRVVDAPTCRLISEPMNDVLAVVRAHCLVPEGPEPYDPHTHEGFWRHLLLREAHDGIIAVLFTTSRGPREPIEQLAEALADRVTGLQWRINDEVADVARGVVAQTWGRVEIEERVGGVRLTVSPEAFLQTNTPGCEVLYDTIGEAIGTGGTLVDLYCGAGAIGLFLADRFDRVVGIEERPQAVVDAQANAARNGVSTASFRAARVEKALDEVQTELSQDGPVHVVVDPPRAGLHPTVARALGAAHVDSLIYVACNPASLARDGAVLAEGGFVLTDLYTVDLFPQTGHIEVVSRWIRPHRRELSA